MAIKLNKAVEAETGATYPELFLRLDINDQHTGKHVQVIAHEFASPAAYEAAKPQLKENILFKSQVFTHDGNYNGAANAKEFGHAEFKKHLIALWGITPITEVNEETGKEETTGTNYFFTETDITIVL